METIIVNVPVMLPVINLDMVHTVLWWCFGSTCFGLLVVNVVVMLDGLDGLDWEPGYRDSWWVRPALIMSAAMLWPILAYFRIQTSREDSVPQELQTVK